MRMHISGSAILVATTFFLQAQDASKQALQQKLGEVKQSIAQNRTQLKQYTWTETTEVSLKGEVKKRIQKDCKYGPDGKVQKTEIGGGEQAEKKSPRGIKGKIVAKKVDELKDYMERVGNLISRYVPPEPNSMQAAMQAGKASLGKSPDGAMVTLLFHDYAKSGDTVTMTFDSAAKKLRAFNVDTYLDDPKDIVKLQANFASLPDGTNYLDQSLLDATGKQIQIKTTNFDYKKAGQ